MTFQDVLAQAIDWLQRDKRITYRALQRQFDLDDAYLEDLKDELIEAKQLARDENGKVLSGLARPPPLHRQPQHPQRLRRRSSHHPSPIRPHISRRKFSPRAVLWKANASRSRCCLPTSKTPPS